MLFKNATTEELENAVLSHGGNASLARKLQSLVFKKGIAELPDDVPNESRKVFHKIRDMARIPHLTVVEKAVSPYDGFAKYLFKGETDEVFEAVRIPLLHRPGKEKYIVCVSSQVGCAAKCAFCATGRLGFKRNLAAWEIVDQVVKIQSDSDLPVRGVVFMGMGEPFLNYREVIRAARIMREPAGMAIDAKSITISTVGITPVIKRFLEEKHPYRLIVSVHGATEALRDHLVPMNSLHGLAGIIDILRANQEVTGKRVTLAWTMISGVNMHREEVRELARLTKGMRLLLDLIPVNDATGRFQPPEREEYMQFLDIIREELGCPIAWRYSGGKDVHGACGMLAGQVVGQGLAPSQTPPTHG